MTPQEPAKATEYKRELRARKAAGDLSDRRRKYAIPEEAKESRRAKRREESQALRRQRGVLPKVAAPKPKPARPPAPSRRRLMGNVVGVSSAVKSAPVDRSARPDTEAFMRENPHLVERLPMDAPWSQPEELGSSHRRVIRGVL